MKATIHHTAITVQDYNWYVSFFQNCFEMTIERTAGEAPHRRLWFSEGIQINEEPDAPAACDPAAIDHVSLQVEDAIAGAEQAISMGCSSLPNGAHWFALPNGVKMELKPNR
jgi:predicted enzyme related to lactoylglutathione lyase